MNEITVFNNDEFGSIRTVTIENEPWFVGKDVADILGYEASRNAIANHVDDEDKLTHQISAAGQNRNMTLINESGLYSLMSKPTIPRFLERTNRLDEGLRVAEKMLNELT